MIRKIRFRFALIIVLAVFVVLSIIIGLINVINYSNVASNADDVLDILAVNDGAFISKPIDPEISPELPFETRFFTVEVYGVEGSNVDDIYFTNIENIAAVSEAKAIEITAKQERTAKEYTITYECGDGTVIEGSVTSANVTHGSEYTVSGAMCDKINEIQTGWKLKDTNSTYDFSHVINNVTSDFVFTAQYKEKDISKYPFWFEVVPVEYVTNEVDIEISAKGTFKINWGDGSVETIDNENANAKQITHKYSFDKNDPDKTYIVRVGGWATGYAYNSNDTQEESVIKIACDVDSPKVTAAGGDIMDIFPRVNGYVQPSFKNMFSTCVHLEDINGDINEEGREKLTFNIVGKPRAYMFEKTFRDTDLTSIPYGLFRHSGTDSTAPGLFAGTFAYTLIEEIPYDLFYEIEGAPAEAMFQSTFSNTPIKSIPGNLFSKINGAPAKNMFMGTFANTKIGEIPGNLFSGIKGAPAEGMFQSTFSNTLIKSIPGNLFSKIKGAPAEAMFQSTFSNTLIKSIPYDLFSGIEGAPAKNMFKQTFMNCKNIESQIPEDLFKGIKGNLAEGSFYQTFAGIVPSIYYTEERPKYPDTNETPNFIPKGLFDDLSGATDENNAMTNVFGSTYNNNGNLEFSGLLTRCPKEFKRVETIFDDYFKHADDENPKVVCDECTEEYSTQGKDDTVCACIDGYAPSRLANDHGWIYCDTGDGSEDLLDKTLNEGDSCEPILHTIKYVCEGVEPYYTHEYKNHDDYFEEYNYVDLKWMLIFPSPLFAANGIPEITVTEKQPTLDSVTDKTILGNMLEVCALLPEKSIRH